MTIENKLTLAIAAIVSLLFFSMALLYHLYARRPKTEPVEVEVREPMEISITIDPPSLTAFEPGEVYDRHVGDNGLLIIRCLGTNDDGSVWRFQELATITEQDVADLPPPDEETAPQRK